MKGWARWGGGGVGGGGGGGGGEGHLAIQIAA